LAEFTWLGMKRATVFKLEAAFTAVGFTVAGWRDATLLIARSLCDLGRPGRAATGPDPTRVRLDVGPRLEIQPNPNDRIRLDKSRSDRRPVRRWMKTVRSRGRSIALLPLMDSLSVKWHDGRAELLTRAVFDRPDRAGRRLTDATIDVSLSSRRS